MLPFSNGDLTMGRGQGVGLCTLWTPKNKFQAQLNDVAVIGNLYSRFGIGIMIRNVLATPSIRHIVITGVDNPEPKRRQAEALLAGNFEAAELYLEADQVAEFYRRTRLHDARHISVRQPEALTAFIQALTSPAAPLPEPIMIPLPQVSQETYPTARSGHLFRFDSIGEAHYAILKEIRTFGQFTRPDSEGHRRQELWQTVVCLSPKCQPVDIPLYENDEISRYGESLWRGDEPETLTYRYGHTMRYRYGDQIQTALDAFAKKPETFRTVLTLWEPLQSMLRDDEPCLTTVHPRVRNGVLDMYAYIRTNEMFRGWPKNAAGLRYFQGKFASALDVEVGELTIASGSAHLYDLDWPAVDTYLSRPKPRKIQFDTKGDWRFFKADGLFIAEHYHDGQLLQVIREPTVDALEKRILPFVNDISHALFIGRELERLA